jgi:hypothetical protein
MSKPFGIVGELASFGVEHRLSLQDGKTTESFAIHVNDAVSRILADPALMHGQRVEAMFEALLVSLGQFRLLKGEDNGRVFPTERFIVPDFRVVLQDGVHWVIEVKNVYETDPFQQERRLMSREYYAKLAAYATATGAELKLAVFWARWSVWTLVSPDRLLDDAGDLKLDMRTAITVSELGRLGDLSIGTRAPLRLRLTMDQEKTSRIGSDGLVKAVIGESTFWSEDREIVDPIEREIAWIFMRHGEWREMGPEPIVDGDRLLSIDFSWVPEEPSAQGFDFIGSLSRMFARYFAEHTVKDKAVVQLRAPLRPGWFSPLISTDYESSTLPLWRFQVQPNYSSGSMHEY